MESLKLTIFLIKGIEGLSFFVLVFVSIIVSVQVIKYSKWRAYSCIALSVGALILAFVANVVPSLNLARILFYTGMNVSAFFVWLTLRKSNKESERNASLLLIFLVAIQFILPIITGFLTMLSNK